MGKRELLLAVGFVLVGVLVYQVTAPATPARSGWSVGGIVDHLRREIRGNQAQAEATHKTTIPAATSLRELRIEVGSVNLTVVGEERHDIETELTVTSNAFDEAEARRTANETKVTVDESGSAVSLGVYFPREGRQRASLTVRVPSRLEARIEKNNTLEISDVAAVSVTGRGQTTIKDVRGRVDVEQRGSSLTVSDVGPIRIKTLGGTETNISNVNGDATISLQGGELTAEALDGSIEIEARNADIKLQNIEKLRRPIRINATGGEIAISDLATELRIDGRETDISVEQTGAAAVSIYNDGNENVELTLPEAGFKIDARTSDGRVTIDEALEKSGVKVATSGGGGGESGPSREEQRVEATVRGGGPAITIRAQRGDIVLRSK